MMPGVEAYFKQKKRGGAPAPKFSVLSEQMHQGGGYRNGSPEHGLDEQMHQASSGYKAGKPTHKLQTQMGQ